MADPHWTRSGAMLKSYVQFSIIFAYFMLIKKEKYCSYFFIQSHIELHNSNFFFLFLKMWLTNFISDCVSGHIWYVRSVLPEVIWSCILICDMSSFKRPWKNNKWKTTVIINRYKRIVTYRCIQIVYSTTKEKKTSFIVENKYFFYKWIQYSEIIQI